jgi:PTS system nitrogen regulatory IIA component
VMTHHEPSLDTASLIRVLLERERLGSTGIGDGVAIPHGKLHGVTHPIISFGRSLKGLDFESMDGEPAFLFFLLVAPENSASVHLKALAKIAKILKNGSFRKVLMEASTKQELYQTIIQNDEEF